MGGQFSCRQQNKDKSIMPVSGVTYMDVCISCIYLFFADMPQKCRARTYRDVKVEGDSILFYTSLSSIKWILKALLFRKKGTKTKPNNIKNPTNYNNKPICSGLAL